MMILSQTFRNAIWAGAALIALATLPGCSDFSSVDGSSKNGSSSRLSAASGPISISNFSQQFRVVDAQAQGFGYGYAATIIYTQGVYHAYFCSAGANTPTNWDYVRHVSSTDAISWSIADVMLNPTTVERSNCDPSVVYYDAGDGPYYYMFYGDNVLNVGGIIYISRSKSPSGPFLKYTDRGTWESAPADSHGVIWPFSRVNTDPNVYGAGQPSVVVKDGKLYMWYMDTTGPQSSLGIYFVTSSNGISWSTPVFTGVVDQSVDVKLDTASGLFLMAEVTPQLTDSSQLLMRTSSDGATWSAPQTILDSTTFPHNGSNVGLGGDDQGHLLPNRQLLVTYAAPYNLNSSTEQWAAWDLWGQYMTVNLPGAVPSNPPLVPIPAPALNVPAAAIGKTIGSIDGVGANGDGTYSVNGWACALRDPGGIQVALYLGSTGVGWFLSNLPSEASVASACGTAGTAYRFSIPLTAAQLSQYGGQAVSVYGISPTGLANNVLSGSGNFTVPGGGAAPAPVATVAAGAVQPAGFFQINHAGGIFWSNGTVAFCAMPSFDFFLSAGGAADLSNVAQISAVPNMRNDGLCH